MKWVLLLVVSLAALGAAAQTNFYVSPSGSDSNDGSSARPWRTIGRASSALVLGSGGAVVNVGPGTYNECIVNNRIGTANQPIVFQSTVQYGAKIVCNSSAGTVWTNGSSSVNTAWTTIKGFEVTATGTTCYGVVTWGSFNTISDNWVHDIPAPGTISGGPCGDPHGGAGLATGDSGSNTDIAFLRNIVDNIGSGATTGCNNQHGIYPSIPRFVVQNNIVSRACGIGIHMYHRTTNGVVTNNVVINNDEGGIQNTADCGTATNDHTTVSNNIVANNGGLHGAPFPIGPISETSGCTGGSNTYRGNILFGNSPNTILFPHGARLESGTIFPTAAQFNALFVNYTGNAKTGDYHLNPNTLAVGGGSSGCASGGITPCVASTDFDGAARSLSGALDVGAFVFGANASSSPNPPTGLTAAVH